MRYLLSLAISLILACNNEPDDIIHSDRSDYKCDNAPLYKFYDDTTKSIFSSFGEDFLEVPIIQKFADIEGYAQIGDPFDKIVIKGSFPDVDKNKYMFNPEKLRKIGEGNGQYLSQEYFNRLEKMEISTGFFFHGTHKSPKKLEIRDGICNTDKNVDLLSYYKPEDTRGFVSLTRSPSLAKRHAQVNFITKNPDPSGGWVYAVFVNGGYLDPLLPDKLEFAGKPEGEIQVYSKWYDQEISQFLGIPWKFFVSFRKVNMKGRFEGPIYIRSGFKEAQPEAYKKIVASLSGAEILDMPAVNRLLKSYENLSSNL